MSSRSIVAVSHPLAAEAGAEMLRAGGNAIDAAAAIQFALNVVEPQASGIGGGAFALIRLASGEVFLLDSRECAPVTATADQFLDPEGRPLPWDEQCVSGDSVGVPGTLRGLALALEHWGSMCLARTLQPAIALVEAGVPVSSVMERRLPEHVKRLAADPAAAAVFLRNRSDSPALRAGDVLVQPDLARTFRLIAEQGPDAFYRGEIACALVAAVQARGGRMTLDDLALYRVVRRQPLAGSYRGFDVATSPPPGSGVTLLQMLGLLEPFDLASLGRLTPARAHLELQAMRLAQADRAAYVGDPECSPVPPDVLLDPTYLASRRSLIGSGRLGPEPRAGSPPSSRRPSATPPMVLDRSGHTTHFVALDRWGNLVCCTSTLEELFGSAIMVPGYGFLLNNELTDFDAVPGGANQVQPRVRPASYMVPTLLMRDGQPWLALGSPGGSRIVSTVLQTILRLVDDALPLAEAVAAPRFVPARFPGVRWEAGLPAATLDGLAQLGHRPAEEPTIIGSVQAIMIDPTSGQLMGAADPRWEGAVIEVD